MGYFLSKTLKSALKEFDLVIYMYDVRYFSSWVDFFSKRFYKKILWGQGISSNLFLNKIRLFLAKFADAIVLYSDQKRSFFTQSGIANEKIFVAHNTIDVPENNFDRNTFNKNAFIFTGTLYKEKKVNQLIDAFAEIAKSRQQLILHIVGDGAEKLNLQQQALNLGIAEKVIFHGFVNEPQKLQQLHNESFACISPDYAGLSVLQSLGRGVPFITKTGALSGGETDNIIHNYNGFFFDSTTSDLIKYMTILSDNKDISLQMAENAFNKFIKECSLESMINGFTAAIRYSLK